MDVDAVADDLYALAPGVFTAARAGDRELAEEIRRLRRPTLSAWASNLLVREQPGEVQRLVHLALRQAHQDLDGGQLRGLSARQHQVTRALARQAGRLTARAGQPISDDTRQEVQDTLHAVLADPDAARQWAEGRLTKPLSAPAGFPTLSRQPAPSAAVRRTEPADQVSDPDAAPARDRKQQQRLEQARRQAADAEQELHDREADLATAEEKLSLAEEEQQQAEQHVDDLARQLKDAESAKQRAREAARQAREHTRTADRAAREARRRADDTAAHAHHLADQMPHTS
ncbi:hypothetical protein [Streptomyces sp. 1222.5]|uniref:hypothetical protein n=1 Tax=Streptomyces sp. 1222.5 TaxID=1881026 RepID=UPI003D74CA14